MDWEGRVWRLGNHLGSLGEAQVRAGKAGRESAERAWKERDGPERYRERINTGDWLEVKWMRE